MNEWMCIELKKIAAPMSSRSNTIEFFAHANAHARQQQHYACRMALARLDACGCAQAAI